MSLTFFYLSPPSLLLLFLILFAFFLMHVWSQHVSNVLLCWFLVSGKPTASLFGSLRIPWDQTKKLMDVMAAYCRCKHLSRHTIRPVLAGTARFKGFVPASRSVNQQVPVQSTSSLTPGTSAPIKRICSIMNNQACPLAYGGGWPLCHGPPLRP